MSKVAIQGNASGTGTFSIVAPNSNTDRTLTIQDASGDVVVAEGGTFKIDSSGNVGIGTSSPSTALEVSNGTIRSSNTGGYYTNLTATGLINYSTTMDFDSVSSYIFKQNGTERMRIDSSGNLLVGTTSNTRNSRLKLVGYETAQFEGYGSGLGVGIYLRPDASASGGNATPLQFYNTSGSIVGNINTTSSSTSYNTSSDYRLKENVVDMTGAIDRVKALKPSQFNFIADPDTTVDGFLAHEVAEVVPEAISGEKDAMRTEEYEVTPAVLDAEGNVVTEAVMGTREVPDYQGIDQSKLVPLLTGALQEAIARIETLEAEVATLKGASA